MTSRTHSLSSPRKSNRLLQLIAILPMASLFATSAGAAILTWDSSGANPTAAVDGGGDWSLTAANWSNGSDDIGWDNASTAVFGAGNGAAGVVIINDPSGTVRAAGLTFNAAGSGNYTIAAADGNTLTLTNSAVTVANGVAPVINAPIAGTVGMLLTGGGTLTLTGANTYTGNTLVRGNTTLIVSGSGSIGSQAGTVYVGSIADSTPNNKSTLTLAGTASLTASNLYINYIVSGLAVDPASSSTLSITGTNAIRANNIYLDAGFNNGSTKGGTAYLTLAGGATLSLSGANGSSPVALMDIANYSYETGGSTGTGITATADFSAGTVNGNITTLNLGTAKAGSGGTSAAAVAATMLFSNGSLSVDTLNIARNTRISGTGANIQTVDGTLTLASGGTGTLTAGAASGTGGITFGAFSNAFTGNLGIANGTINILGATLVVQGNITNVNAAKAIINLAGGTLDMLNANTSQRGTIGSATGLVTLNVTSGTLKNVAEINGGTTGLTVAATSAGVTFAGTNSYTGTTTVSSGRLSINGSLPNSPVTVAAGATLGGSGTIGSAVSINGTLSPGNSPGILSLGSTLSFADGSVFLFNLGPAANPGVDTSEIAFSSLGNNVSGTGSVTLALNGAINYTKTYTLFANTSTTPGDFQFAAVTGYDNAAFTPIFSSSNNNYTLSFTPTAVPEPASLGLLALGGAALLTRRRR